MDMDKAHAIAHLAIDAPAEEITRQHEMAVKLMVPWMIDAGFSEKQAHVIIAMIETTTLAGSTLGTVFALEALRNVLDGVIADDIGQVLQEIKELTFERAGIGMSDAEMFRAFISRVTQANPEHN